MSELDYLNQLHASGRISRRDFIGRAVALGAGIALASTLAARNEAIAADAPRKGGTLRLGLGGGSTTDSLEPGSWTDSVMVDAGFAIYNPLIENGADNKPIPKLAENYEAKPGAVEWILNIRKGVTFHNGKTLDADDIVYSLNLHRGQTKSGAAGPMKEVADIKKLGPNQVQITLNSGDADLPYVLTDYHLQMVPNEWKDWSKAAGTGAYMVESADMGVRLQLKKNPNFWQADRGHVDAVDITVINDTSARMNALVSGQVDAINRVDPKTAELVKKSGKAELVVAPGGWHTVISMMQDREPFNNLDLRLALKYGIDRQQIVKALFSGYGQLGNDHPIPKGDPNYNSELPQIAYDPDKAKFHFKKSGLTNPKVVIQASDAAFNGAVDMATLFQASAGKAGIPIEVKKEPADGFWDNVWLKGACVTSYWAGRPAATQMLAVAYAADAPWNESHYKSEKFNQLLMQARAELDDAKRKQMIWDMQALLHDDGATIVPAFRDWVDGHNKNVGGHTPHSGFDMCNGYIAEKAWLKA